jgi:putative nucleotidyltransferase with HDIG domain
MNDQERVFKKLFSGNHELPALPAIYNEAIKLIDNPYTTTEKLSKLITQDQAIVFQVIRLCNSPLFSARQEITSLNSAINYLGMNVIKDMLLQISLVRAFPFALEKVPDFDLTVFWEHSLGTAYLTEHIAEKMNVSRNELFYVGGLLHDIGKLLVYHVHPDKFARIVTLQTEKGYDDLSAEKEILGIDHAAIGAILAATWNFAPEVIEMIRCHHVAVCEKEVGICLVRMANHFAKAAGLSFPWDTREISITHDFAWDVLTRGNRQSIDVERMTFEIMDEAEKVKETVRSMLSRKVT